MTGGQGSDKSKVSGEEFRLLVESVMDYAIFLIDDSGHVLTWNDGARRIKGYEAPDIIGRHFSTFYTPEDRADGRPGRLLDAARLHGRVEDEGWRVRRDGTRFWADVIITALRNADGVPYAFAKVTRDMTERREAEEQRAALLAEQRARSAAEEAIRVRDRFLSVASHELKTPVASLRLVAEGLVHAHASDRLTPERLRTGLDRITRASEHLANLVDDLLDVSRLESGLPLTMAPVDVVEVAREVIARFADLEGSNGRIDLSGAESAMVIGDAARLDQVLANLVDNALRYSTPPSRVGIDVERTGTDVAIQVTDEGIGVEPQDADAIFEPFGRGTNAPNVPGFGLGLFIVREIVRRHGGTVAIGPRPKGPGALVTVRLPSADA
jgi:PAS domain S-box-containing protein